MILLRHQYLSTVLFRSGFEFFTELFVVAAFLAVEQEHMNFDISTEDLLGGLKTYVRVMIVEHPWIAHILTSALKSTMIGS